MERKKVIMIAGSVYPDASATGNICYQIAKELNEKYDLYIVSLLNTYISDKEVVTPEGIRVTLERNRWFALRQVFASRNCKFGLNVIRLIDRISSMLFVPKNTWWYARRIKKLICAEAKKDQDLCVITFSEPFETHWGVLKARKLNFKFKWITIFEDAFATSVNSKNLFLGLSGMERMEKKVLSASDHVFVTPEILDNRCVLYQDYEKKVATLPYIIKDNTRLSGALEKKETRMIYAGRFYKDIRPVEPLLKCFDMLQMDDIIMDFFTAGECENTIREYAKSTKGNIRLNAMITHERLLEEYAKSDILINMENNVKEYKPSKQYEYIGTGKPIISFYYYEPDAELAKYPLALQIHVGKLCEHIEQARIFIANAQGKRLGFDEITNIYQDNSIKHIVSMIDSCINDANKNDMGE